MRTQPRPPDGTVALVIGDAPGIGRTVAHSDPAAGRLHALSRLLPRRLREALRRALRTDRVLTEIDHAARRRYEERGR